MELEFSKYPKPGIYLEEVNDSATTQSAATESIINFVPGFSRKGVFNRPVLVSNPADAERYFGTVDRTLESKGSYFHRTITTMLQQGPVWALNLLATTSVDTLAFRSISLSPAFDNSPELSIAYPSVFRRDGFWTRDTELFTYAANKANLSTNSADKVLHMTNISDKKISVFLVKSAALGFDVTAESWYGGRDKVPMYIRPQARVSDYLVRLVVIAGDWSDYRTLSNDAHWAKYFNPTGLRSSLVDSFLADRQVTRLLDSTCSLIPYFRDRNNNNLFIESVANAATDKTGLFVAFDTDKFETDVPNGFIDLVGDSLAGSDRETIAFMSYSDTIIETDSFPVTSLDRPGNVAGLGSANGVTAVNGQGYLSGISYTGFNTTTKAFAFNVNDGAYAVMSGKVVSVNDTNDLPASALGTPAGGHTNYAVNTIVLNTDGTFSLLVGPTITGTPNLSEAAIASLATAQNQQFYPAGYANNAIVLGYGILSMTDGGVFAETFVPVGLGANLSISTGANADATISAVAPDTIKVVFNGTEGVSKSQYVAWRRKQYFDALVAGKDLQRSALLDAAGIKQTFNNRATWLDNAQSSAGDRYFTVSVPGTSLNASSGFVLYFGDDEFTIGTSGLRQTTSAGFGKIGKYSTFAQSFYNGMIKTGDFFYPTVQKEATLAFSKDADGYDVITISNAGAELQNRIQEGYIFYVSGHAVNNGKYTVLSTSHGTSGVSSYYELRVNEAVTAYAATTASVHDYASKTYLKLYTLNDEVICEFTNKSYDGLAPLAAGLLAQNTTLDVFSDEQAYAQTVELSLPTGYLVQDTKILVDSARYPEVAVGDYLQAYVDEDALAIGEEPRRMTRIISKRPWTGNSSPAVIASGKRYSEIVTDAKIYLDQFGTTYQTTRFTGVHDYVDTFKAVVLSGFQVHAESVPNGTEERQSKILDVLATGTAMFEAVTNKNRFSFRYLVDSFGKGLTELSKHQLVDICGKRKNALGFISTPSMKDFRKSTSPSFIDETGALKVEFIATGGDLESNPAFLYSLADGDGASCVGYFAPYAVVNENGRPLSVPMAPYAACTYMRKQNTSNSGVYPWTIAAGTENGLIKGIANLEYDFTDTDVKWLNQVGINPVLYKLNTGFAIETENTAEQSPRSSLSYLHTREVLIELENALYAMLLPYQWKFNIPAIRAEIKQKADDLCERFVERNALYAYKNICDASNNTPAVIDNQFGLLETYVEVVKGMGVIVNYVNVEKTGSINGSTGTETINSTGFNLG